MDWFRQDSALIGVNAAMDVLDQSVDIFRDFISDPSFPCVGAKSALARNGLRMIVGGDLRCSSADREVLAALQQKPEASAAVAELFAIVVLFPLTPPLSEIAFETYLWQRLQALHDADRLDFAWDSSVSSDPGSENFGLSLGGTAFFVVGLHPGASRLARRAPMATLAFNPNAQFRRLKQDGSYGRLRNTVRNREIANEGDLNPMLADFGEASEARQYSGRRVASAWQCPFTTRRGDPL